MKMRISHVHLKVRDLQRATTFYQRFLGLEVRERIADRYVFMSGGFAELVEKGGRPSS